MTKLLPHHMKFENFSSICNLQLGKFSSRSPFRVYCLLQLLIFHLAIKGRKARDLVSISISVHAYIQAESCKSGMYKFSSIS